MSVRCLIDGIAGLLREAWIFLRRYPGWILGSVACLGIALLLLVPHDGAIHLWIMHERPEALARLARLGREWGKFVDTPVICGGLFLLGWRLRRPTWRRAALAAFLAAALSGISANLIRASVGRARPHVGQPTMLAGPTANANYQSFPSGHTATSGGYAVALSVALPGAAPLALLSGGWVVWSSLYAGSHYLSDILTSLLICFWIGLALGRAGRGANKPAVEVAREPVLASSDADMAGEGSPRSLWTRASLSQVARLLLLGALLLLPGTGRLPLMDRDEPRFAQATREMRESGDWFVPTFNREFRFDKPPLTYWLMAPGYRWLGENELGARLHSVVSTLLLALLLYAFGRTLGLPRRLAEGGAAAMLFSAQFLAHGRAAVADMPMVLAVTAAHYALYNLLLLTPSPTAARRFRLLLCFSLCLGFLAKGPVAWLTPLLTLVLFRHVFYRHAKLPWRQMGLQWVLPLAVFGLAAWGIPALRRTEGDFWRVGIGFHVVERGMRRFHGRLFVPFYYPLTALLSLFPWSSRFGRVWGLIRGHWDKRCAFMLAWLLSPMLIFLFYATQLPHYTMPGFPAYFLLLGLAWTSHSPSPAWSRRLGRALSMIVFLLSLICLAVSLLPPLDDSWKTVLAGAGLALSGLYLAPAMAPRGQPRQLVLPGVVAAVGVFLLSTGLGKVHVVPRVSRIIDALPVSAVCYTVNYREPSLVFYSGRQWHETSVEHALAELGAGGKSCVVALEHEVRIGNAIVAWLRGRDFRHPGRDNRDKLAVLPEEHRVAVVRGLSPARGVIVDLAVYASGRELRGPGPIKE